MLHSITSQPTPALLLPLIPQEGRFSLQILRHFSVAPLPFFFFLVLLPSLSRLCWSSSRSGPHSPSKLRGLCKVASSTSSSHSLSQLLSKLDYGLWARLSGHSPIDERALPILLTCMKPGRQAKPGGGHGSLAVKRGRESRVPVREAEEVNRTSALSSLPYAHFPLPLLAGPLFSPGFNGHRTYNFEFST